MCAMVELGREKKVSIWKAFQTYFLKFPKIRFDTLVMKLATI